MIVASLDKFALVWTYTPRDLLTWLTKIFKFVEIFIQGRKKFESAILTLEGDPYET